VRILIIDDEQEILEKLKLILEGEHYTIDIAADGQQALERIWADEYDLILLDIMLPHVDGFQILQELREAKISTPVLMLTARSSIDDRVTGLDKGADDYLTKPFSIAELLARIRALIRRSKNTDPILRAGPVRLDTISRDVYRDEEKLQLTSREFAILEFLLHNMGRAVSRFTLAEHVWGDAFDIFSMSNFIDVHISNLRKKIEPPGSERIIKTIRGFGYRIERSDG